MPRVAPLSSAAAASAAAVRRAQGAMATPGRRRPDATGRWRLSGWWTSLARSATSFARYTAPEAAQKSAKHASTRSSARPSKSRPAKTIPARTKTFLLHWRGRIASSSGSDSDPLSAGDRAWVIWSELQALEDALRQRLDRQHDQPPPPRQVNDRVAANIHGAHDPAPDLRRAGEERRLRQRRSHRRVDESGLERQPPHAGALQPLAQRGKERVEPRLGGPIDADPGAAAISRDGRKRGDARPRGKSGREQRQQPHRRDQVRAQDRLGILGIAVAPARVPEYPLRQQHHVRRAHPSDEAGVVAIEIVNYRLDGAAARPQVGGDRLELLRITAHQQELLAPLRPDPRRRLGDGGRGAEHEDPHRCTRRQNDDENAGSRWAVNSPSRGNDRANVSADMRASFAG